MKTLILKDTKEFCVYIHGELYTSRTPVFLSDEATKEGLREYITYFDLSIPEEIVQSIMNRCEIIDIGIVIGDLRTTDLAEGYKTYMGKKLNGGHYYFYPNSTEPMLSFDIKY